MVKVCDILRFSSCALPELGRASATNVNKFTNFEYSSLFSAANTLIIYLDDQSRLNSLSHVIVQHISMLVKRNLCAARNLSQESGGAEDRPAKSDAIMFA